MLPKNRRIARLEMNVVLKTGKRFSSPHLLLYIASISPTKPSRFSFSISKKIYKNASDRNLYRRRGYAVIESIISSVSPGYMCFFSFKKGTYPVSFVELETEIKGLLSTITNNHDRITQ